jgi:adenine-specific DNA-methyltransferase
VKQAFFTAADFEELKNNHKNIFLLNALNPNNEAVKNYLSQGEEQGINKKFLTASRKPWYSLENRPPAPIWVSVFNRTGLRFIRNEAGISNLTTFHGIYPTSENLMPEKIDLLFAYLLTNIAKQLFSDNRREYGNGLQKFEPNDINNAQMLNLDGLEVSVKNQILAYYYSYRESALENKPQQSLVNSINKILTEHFLQE